MPAETPDAELLARLRARDETAFLELVNRLHGPLTRLARSIAGDAAAEEIVQDTWAAALTGIDTFEGKSSLKTWLFAIVLNRAKSRRERDQRQVPLSSLGPQDDEEGGVDPSWFTENGHWNHPVERWSDDTPDRVLNDKELRKRLLTALEQLPERLRTVLVMRDIEGLDSAEVCNVLGVSETNQRVLLHRARTRMRALLEEETQDETRRRP